MNFFRAQALYPKFDEAGNRQIGLSDRAGSIYWISLDHVIIAEEAVIVDERLSISDPDRETKIMALTLIDGALIRIHRSLWLDAMGS